jgi:hypothetical protein
MQKQEKAVMQEGQRGDAPAGNCHSSCPVFLRQTRRFAECRYAGFSTL